MGLQDFQRRFAAALTSDKASPQEIFSGDKVQMRAALAIYRNNVAYSLTEVLAEDFPIIKQLLGEDFFNHAAARFLKDNLPTQRSLIGFGAGFAEFLAGWEEAQDWLWLADVARIEMARREVFHAADDGAVQKQSLHGLSDEDLTQKHFVLRASVRVLRLDWPADKIWRAHQDEGGMTGMEVAPEEICLLIRRATPDIIIERVDHALADFLTACTLTSCTGGKNLGAVVEFMLEQHRDFDLAAVLASCFAGNYLKEEIYDERIH